MAQKGPATGDVEYHDVEEMTAGFRVVSCYDARVDGVLTRLDVLVNGETNHQGLICGGKQVNAAFYSGTKMFMVPSNGIVDGMSLRARPKDLIEAFRGLADLIEEEVMAAEMVRDGILRPDQR